MSYSMDVAFGQLGVLAPTRAIVMAGVDPGGDLRAIKLDMGGRISAMLKDGTSVLIQGVEGTTPHTLLTDATGKLRVRVEDNVAVTGTVGIAGPVAVTGSFYPATQPVSGTVSVGNFPSSQAVAVSNWPASWAITSSTLATEATLAQVRDRLPEDVAVAAKAGRVFSAATAPITMAGAAVNVVLSNPAGSGKTLVVLDQSVGCIVSLVWERYRNPTAVSGGAAIRPVNGATGTAPALGQANASVATLTQGATVATNARGLREEVGYTFTGPAPRPLGSIVVPPGHSLLWVITNSTSLGGLLSTIVNGTDTAAVSLRWREDSVA